MTGITLGIPQTPAPSRRSLIVGRVLSGLGIAFLAFDGSYKLFASEESLRATADLGWPIETVVPLGILQLILLAIHLVPRTAILGAVLWTGYLGGAIAVHVRIFNPLFSQVLFPVYIAALIWGGLWLRDRRTRVMLAPVR